MKKTLREMALDSELSSRFVAREDDMNRQLTNREIYEEALYQLDDIPYKVMSETDPEIARKAMRQMKAIIKRYQEGA